MGECRRSPRNGVNGLASLTLPWSRWDSREAGSGYIVVYTVQVVGCILYCVHFILYSVHCKVNSEQETVNTTQRTLWIGEVAGGL